MKFETRIIQNHELEVRLVGSEHYEGWFPTLYKITIGNWQISVTYYEVLNYNHGQRHLATHVRKCYCSSRWYKCTITNTKTYEDVSYKVKIKGKAVEETFERAFEKILAYIQA